MPIHSGKFFCQLRTIGPFSNGPGRTEKQCSKLFTLNSNRCVSSSPKNFSSSLLQNNLILWHSQHPRKWSDNGRLLSSESSLVFTALSETSLPMWGALTWENDATGLLVAGQIFAFFQETQKGTYQTRQEKGLYCRLFKEPSNYWCPLTMMPLAMSEDRWTETTKHSRT